ncbi:hypothetical protein AAVH_15136 [Aphelenchoides avenae]|nr:hypothetical protein AAVH_15136 [Aphelenchus avenae]
MEPILHDDSDEEFCPDPYLKAYWETFGRRLAKGLGIDEKDHFERIEEEQVRPLRRTRKAVTRLVDLSSKHLREHHSPYLQSYVQSMIRTEVEFHLSISAYDKGHESTTKELAQLQNPRDPRTKAGKLIKKLRDYRPPPHKPGRSQEYAIKVTAKDMVDARKFLSALRKVGAAFGVKEGQ